MENFDSAFTSEDFNDVDLGEDQNFTVPTDNDDDIFSSVEPKEKTIDDIFDDPESSTVLEKFLESKGFVDSKIKVIDEDNEESEIKFSDLSEEEQLDILNSFSVRDKMQVPQLAQDEQSFLQELRNNGLTLEQFLELYREGVIQEAGIQFEPSYEIDQYTDEELFLLDLKNKFDFSDEELQTELEKELQNKALFDKKVDKIRSEYRELEEQYHTNQQAEFEAQQQQQYNDFVDQMTHIASNVPDFHGLELEDHEKNETLSYLLNLDENGMSQFYKDLNTPENLYEVAWYLKYGKDAFRIIEDAYEAEIAKLKAKEDKPRVVRQTNKQNNLDSFNDIF